MSASSKKKLRKEQNLAAMTEKQLNEQKEAKKLKKYTWTFVIAMILVVLIAIGSVIRVPLTGALDRGSHAVNINSHELTTTDLSYYFVDAINEHYNEAYNTYGSYAQFFLGFIPETPLNEQKYGASEDFETWADYFMDKAIQNAKKIYALYDAAVAAGHKLTEDEQKYLDSAIESVELMAEYYGYSSANSYLRATYSTGANVKTYKAYYTINTIASSYYDAHMETLEYVEDDFRAYEKDKYNDFSSYSYATYTVTVSNYLKGGTKSEDGKTTTYSDAEKEAALKDAKADADALVAGTYADFEAFEKAVKALKINEGKSSVTVSKVEDALFTNITNTDVKDWLGKTEHKAGELTALEVKTTTTNEDKTTTETITSYTVVYYIGVDTNETKLVDVQHVLIKFKNGTTDANGNTTYPAKEKEAAKKAAEDLMAEWKKGAATKESFAELAKTKSEDTGSKANGGLYEDIYPGQMVETFNDWCFDANRKPGDTGIIATDYGYHLMYFVETNDMTFRDYMIQNKLTAEDMEKWHDDLTAKVTSEIVDLSRMEWDYEFG